MVYMQNIVDNISFYDWLKYLSTRFQMAISYKKNVYIKRR